MRSPSDCEAQISDPTDIAPVFSLLMVGRERLLAGGALNALLKVYDMRMPGGRTYDYMDANPNIKQTVIKQPSFAATRCLQDANYSWGGWNLFSSPRPDPTAKRAPRLHPGPIYSLSRPSSSSSSIYVGMEGLVLHLNISGMLDKHPDPLFTNQDVRDRNGGVDALKTWENKVCRLAMYEQTESGGMPLRVQAPVGTARRDESLPGYDERWFRAGAGL